MGKNQRAEGQILLVIYIRINERNTIFYSMNIFWRQNSIWKKLKFMSFRTELLKAARQTCIHKNRHNTCRSTRSACCSSLSKSLLGISDSGPLLPVEFALFWDLTLPLCHHTMHYLNHQPHSITNLVPEYTNKSIWIYKCDIAKISIFKLWKNILK